MCDQTGLSLGNLNNAFLSSVYSKNFLQLQEEPLLTTVVICITVFL